MSALVLQCTPGTMQSRIPRYLHSSSKVEQIHFLGPGLHSANTQSAVLLIHNGKTALWAIADNIQISTFSGQLDLHRESYPECLENLKAQQL